MAKQKKSVLIISQHFPPEKSGNASRIHDMAYHLTISGVRIKVISPFPSFPPGAFPRKWAFFSESAINGIDVINIWTWQPQSKNPGFISRMGYYLIFPLNVSLWLVFNQREFDVIITSAPPLFTHIPGLMFKKIFHKPWILDIRDLWIDASVSLGFIKSGSFFEKISRSFERKCLVDSDRIGVTTLELGKRLPLQDAIKDKIVHIPNGVDIANFAYQGHEKKSQIIYAGNIGHAQDLENVILAFRQIVKKYPVKLVIAGDGDILPALKELVQSEKMVDWVSFPGILPREEIPRLISESLIGLAPLKKMDALEYAAPTKVYEYMACEIPFLGCGKGEIENIARDSGAGVIAENNPDAIAVAIMNLLANPEQMKEMGTKGRRYVTESYSRKSIALRLQNVIEEIT
jgi:glycosyltransferase involved in cell wall biosynthesis